VVDVALRSWNPTVVKHDDILDSLECLGQLLFPNRPSFPRPSRLRLSGHGQGDPTNCVAEPRFKSQFSRCTSALTFTVGGGSS
jgi:hypothetical protein